MVELVVVVVVVWRLVKLSKRVSRHVCDCSYWLQVVCHVSQMMTTHFKTCLWVIDWRWSVALLLAISRLAFLSDCSIGCLGQRDSVDGAASVAPSWGARWMMSSGWSFMVALSFLLCFDIVGWVIEGCPAYKSCSNFHHRFPWGPSPNWSNLIGANVQKCIFVVWPTTSCCADWSKHDHVTLVIIGRCTLDRLTVKHFPIALQCCTCNIFP